jgi:hypothetical protein
VRFTNVIRVIKSRRMMMKWEDHVDRMRAMRNRYKILVGKSEGKRLWKDLGIDEKMILEWILWK